MSKYKITKKTSSKGTKFSLIPLLLFIFIAVAMFLLGYFNGMKNAHTHDGENVTVELPETSKEHIHEEVPEMPAAESDVLTEEAGTFPSPDAEAVNTVQMGADVWYTLYTDGTLLVAGSGSTWDFETPGKMISYLVEQLQTERVRAKGEWLYAVTDIMIDSNITRLGKSALAMYTKAESVTYYGTLESVGENAFRKCGEWLKSNKETVWNIDFTNTRIESGAFNGCTNPPVECEKTDMPEIESEDSKDNDSSEETTEQS